MVLPTVVGYKLTGQLVGQATATDLVLTITQNLRSHGVVGKFVEFFGDGCRFLSIADRATIANMCPEYGATVGFFPVDQVTLDYLRQSGTFFWLVFYSLKPFSLTLFYFYFLFLNSIFFVLR